MTLGNMILKLIVTIQTLLKFKKITLAMAGLLFKYILNLRMPCGLARIRNLRNLIGRGL